MEEVLVFPPWLDLPEPLAELVLERLSLVDYIRFAAVCLKWRSIQKGHRLRYAPHPPPMANQLPWLVPLPLCDPQQEMEFYSPSDRKSYRLPIPSSLHKSRCLASCHGWLLLLEHGNCDSTPNSKHKIFLFNPITTAQIPLMPLPWYLDRGVVGAMSAPPTDPDCIVLLVLDHSAFLYQPNDHCATGWTIIRLTELWRLRGGSAIYCGGKFYYLYGRGCKLYVIDPFLLEAASPLVMRYPHGASFDASFSPLLEIGGELFLVQTLYGSYAIRGFRVFKADLSNQEWVRVGTLGDHVLFLGHGGFSVSFLAADVGFKRNSIYTCREVWHDEEDVEFIFAWGVFDLGTGRWTEEDTLTGRSLESWILPTLDFAGLAKASD